MNLNNAELAQQRVDRHAKLAFFHQGFWIVLMLALLIYDPPYIRIAGECLATCALLASFIASKLYITAGKELENHKKLSPEEQDLAIREYSRNFFSPYVLWVGSIIWFSLGWK